VHGLEILLPARKRAASRGSTSLVAGITAATQEPAEADFK
jgi:hypothetical protein